MALWKASEGHRRTQSSGSDTEVEGLEHHRRQRPYIQIQMDTIMLMHSKGVCVWGGERVFRVSTKVRLRQPDE